MSSTRCTTCGYEVHPVATTLFWIGKIISAAAGQKPPRTGCPTCGNPGYSRWG